VIDRSEQAAESLRNSLLLTDLYQLNMLQAYRDAGMDRTAVFEVFGRKSPARRGFWLAAGLTSVAQFLETARFDDGDLTAHAVAVRRILDEGGLQAVRIFASGGLDEDMLSIIVRTTCQSTAMGSAPT
jgi:nicotinic acid phosphoribosyltransferase